MHIDIFINVLSDFIFITLIALVVGLLNFAYSRGRFGRARQFFDFDNLNRIKIFVSGFEHPGVRTRRVVNAEEYQVAVEMKNALVWLTRNSFFRRLADSLAGLIGQERPYPEPTIEVSPLDEVTEPIRDGTIIIVGGPVSNQLGKFYLEGSPKYRFNADTEKYEERHGEEYQEIKASGDIAIVEKRSIHNQVVFLLHGFGEEQTCRASRYLSKRWKRLYDQYGMEEFGIRV